MTAPDLTCSGSIFSGACGSYETTVPISGTRGLPGCSGTSSAFATCQNAGAGYLGRLPNARSVAH